MIKSWNQKVRTNNKSDYHVHVEQMCSQNKERREEQPLRRLSVVPDMSATWSGPVKRS